MAYALSLQITCIMKGEIVMKYLELLTVYMKEMRLTLKLIHKEK